MERNSFYVTCVNYFTPFMYYILIKIASLECFLDISLLLFY